MTSLRIVDAHGETPGKEVIPEIQLKEVESVKESFNEKKNNTNKSWTVLK